MLFCSITIFAFNAHSKGGGENYLVGINGSACAYETIEDAIASASSGDIIYISSSAFTEFLGDISIDLTFVPAQATAPDFSGCEQEFFGNIAFVRIYGNGMMNSTEGGLVKIINGATVTFRHIWLRDAIANKGGVLAVMDGSSLILDGAFVTGGNALQDGGNIYVASNSTVTLMGGAAVFNGHALGDGGGVALVDSELIITNGYVGIDGNGFNTADNDGGGIYANNSTVNMISPLSNVLWNVSEHFGGGIYAVESFIETSIDAMINNNKALSGGGIYLAPDSTATLADTYITNNYSGSSGAIFIEEAVLNLIDGSLVTNNWAGSGGGINVSESGTLTVDNSIISDNVADDVGGGVTCNACSEINIINDSVISGNASGFGGGIFVSDFNGVVTVTNSSIRNNQATSPSEGYGGGIAILSGSLVISDSSINVNSASISGGGIYAKPVSGQQLERVELLNVGFSLNTSAGAGQDEGGAAVYIHGVDSLSVINTNFVDNDAQGGFGGGMFIKEVGEALISDGLFLLNKSYRGGGIYSSFNQLTINNGTHFSQNEATLNGGALNVLFGSVIVNQASFQQNSAVHGGAIKVQEATLDITNSNISLNVATTAGGGVYVEDARFSFKSAIGHGNGQCVNFELSANRYCGYLANNAAGRGGAFAFETDSNPSNDTVVLSDLFLSGNIATEADGGGSAIHVNGRNNTTIDVTNLLLVHNGSVDDPSSVIKVEGSTPLNLNSLTIADNNGSPLWVDEVTANVEMTNSILYGNSQGPRVTVGISSFIRNCNNSQNVSAPSQSMGGNWGNPQFTTTPRGDYRLASNSPSIDKCFTGPSQDLDGLIRSGMYDQGAFEADGLIDIIFYNGFEN